MCKVLESVCVHVTGACNLSCNHCFERDPSRFLHHRDLIEFINSLKKIGLLHVSISGGEPTHHKDIDKILLALHKEIKVTLTTNGTNYEKIDEILKSTNANLNIRVSLDGTKEIHEDLRGPNTYKIALNSIMRIKECRGWVGVNTVLHNRIDSCLCDLVGILNKIKVNHWALMSLFEKKNEKIKYNISKEELSSLALKFYGELSFWDYGKDVCNYLLVREDGSIVLPAFDKNEDIIIGNIRRYSIKKLIETIKEHRNCGHHFDWYKRLKIP